MAKTTLLNSPSQQSSAVAGAEFSHAYTDFAMLSHRGRVRRSNQDACAALPDRGVFVVCDGMGGAAAGEVASKLAADAFLHCFSRTAPGGGATDSGSAASVSPSQSRDRLKLAIDEANQAILRYARRAPQLTGMGTTLVSALWDPSDARTLWVANVGDSRCYRLRVGRLELLTEDHSLVQEQVRAGTLNQLQAAASPMRNIITRAVGSMMCVEADITGHSVESGDVYLLASDGLTRELEEATIARIINGTLATAPAKGRLERACCALVEAANAHGGRDNITVLLLRCA